MLLLVEIDLSSADIVLFEAYEERVLALLPKHGATLLERVRSSDGPSEMHLIDFPDAAALASFSADPVRLAARDLWQKSRASAVSKEVIRHPERVRDE